MFKGFEKIPLCLLTVFAQFPQGAEAQFVQRGPINGVCADANFSLPAPSERMVSPSRSDKLSSRCRNGFSLPKHSVAQSAAPRFTKLTKDSPKILASRGVKNQIIGRSVAEPIEFGAGEIPGKSGPRPIGVGSLPVTPRPQGPGILPYVPPGRGPAAIPGRGVGGVPVNPVAGQPIPTGPQLVPQSGKFPPPMLPPSNLTGGPFAALPAAALAALTPILGGSAPSGNSSQPGSSNPGASSPGASGGAGKPCKPGDPSLPKCISFSAEDKKLTPPCPVDQALMGFTLLDQNSAPPGEAKHCFAYTHGFCGPTGSGPVEASEAAWCSGQAALCGLSYPSDDWHGQKGAECLIKFIAENAPKGCHFEIDNCSQYKAGNLKCYEDLIAAMKKNPSIGDRRIAIKNVNKDESQTIRTKYFDGPDSKYVSNFVLVEEEFNKADVQSAFSGTCASVAQSMNTHDYMINENHIEAGGGGAVANSTSNTRTAAAPDTSKVGRP